MPQHYNFPSSLNPVAGPVGAALTQPVVPVAPRGTANPNIIQRFLQGLENDPNLQQALLTTGLTLLGDPQQGESGFGTFSRAALTGNQVLQSRREAERLKKLQEEQLELQRQNVESQIETRGKTAEQGDRRLDIAERGQAIDVSQFNNRIGIMREQIESAEDIAAGRNKTALDVAGIRANATKDAASAGATGAERIEDARVEALVKGLPELYPDTDEGRARARIAVSGLGFAPTPESKLRASTMVLGELQKQNMFLDPSQQLSPEQMIQVTMDTVNALSGGTDPISEAARGVGDQDSQEVSIVGKNVVTGDGRNARNAGKVSQTPDGKFVIVTPSGEVGPFTQEELQQVLTERNMRIE